ncbi:MAG: cryptochrome/photolyase family protein [Betaproteobacteria bacterium]|nr:cryptochrome/photolyase family protein [Betaproteobacteria bacterium]
MSPTPLRHLVIVLGDQLDVTASAFDDFDARTDAIWMAEVDQESTHVWSSKSRIAVFLSAMRHFAQAQRELGRRVLYTEIDAADNTHSLAGELQRALEHHAAQGLVMTAPGDWRVLHDLKAVAQSRGLPLEIRDDRHFITTVRDFKAHAAGG